MTFILLYPPDHPIERYKCTISGSLFCLYLSRPTVCPDWQKLEKINISLNIGVRSTKFGMDILLDLRNKHVEEFLIFLKIQDGRRRSKI